MIEYLTQYLIECTSPTPQTAFPFLWIRKMGLRKAKQLNVSRPFGQLSVKVKSDSTYQQMWGKDAQLKPSCLPTTMPFRGSPISQLTELLNTSVLIPKQPGQRGQARWTWGFCASRAFPGHCRSPLRTRWSPSVQLSWPCHRITHHGTPHCYNIRTPSHLSASFSCSVPIRHTAQRTHFDHSIET